LLGACLFVNEMGIGAIVLSNVSQMHEYVVQGAQFQQASLGYLRWAASLMTPAFYLLLAWFASAGKRWFSCAGVLVLVIGVLATLFPLLNRSRTGVVTVFIVALVIWHYLHGGISIRKILIAVVLVIPVVVIMGAPWRGASDVDAVSPYLAGEKILDTMAGSMNFFAISKTSHIFDAIPGKFDHQHGLTLLTWLFAPVPRTLWMDKPPVFVWALLGQEVIETLDPSGEGAAIPPMIVAELFLNFGPLGVPVGMFILGYCLRLLYRSFRPLPGCNRSAAVLYVPFVFACSFRRGYPAVPVSVWWMRQLT